MSVRRRLWRVGVHVVAEVGPDVQLGDVIVLDTGQRGQVVELEVERVAPILRGAGRNGFKPGWRKATLEVLG